MSATAVGVTELFGQTTPSGCVVNQSSQERTVSKKDIKDETGVTKLLTSLNLITTKTTLSGYGFPALSMVVENRTIGSNVAVCTSLQISESNDDHPKWTAEYTSWSSDG